MMSTTARNAKRVDEARKIFCPSGRLIGITTVSYTHLAAMRARIGQRRIGKDLSAPTLIIGQVPVKQVQLLPRKDIDHAANFGKAPEMP